MKVKSFAGGTALFTGLRDRLERELAEAAPHNAKVKVTSPANSLERRFSVWIGAHQPLQIKLFLLVLHLRFASGSILAAAVLLERDCSEVAVPC